MGVALQQQETGGKKAVDAELNLVPFIDLLVCCICFLLITAVWTQMAKIEVQQRVPGRASNAAPQNDQVKAKLLVAPEGYVLQVAAERLAIPKQGTHYDTGRLAARLRDLRARLAHPCPLTVVVADGISYRHLIRVIDIARRQHFQQVGVAAENVG